MRPAIEHRLVLGRQHTERVGARRDVQPLQDQIPRHRQRKLDQAFAGRRGDDRQHDHRRRVDVEACREVLGRLDRFHPESEAAFRHWLFATASRKVKDRIDYYRAAKRNVDREVGELDATGAHALDAVYADLLTPSADLDMRERVARIEGAFDRLSQEHREVITLTRLVGLPHRQVAEAMGRSEVASRMLLYRALAQLGAELERAG